ncbi:MAG: HepT-like ribonuclease domain-containing protein [Paludibacter sp.]
MDNQTNKILTDILICIENINSYLGDSKIFEEYDKNHLLQDAVERNLITIGEAMSVLLKKSPNILISNARKIVDTRNRLTHGYDDIENVQVWSIVIKYLPILKLEVENLIDK